MPRIITEIQTTILRVLRESQPLFTNSYFLSGGTALSEFHFQHRYSEDLDFFVRVATLERIDLRPDAAIFIEQLRAAGITVQLEQNEPTKIRLLVASEEESTRVDMVTDHGPDLSTLRMLEDIPVDSFEDMAARKLVAFSERGDTEAKDAVDLYFLVTRGGLDLDRLIALASQKSADFENDEMLLFLAQTLMDCARPEYIRRMNRLLFATEVDTTEIARFLSERGRELFRRLAPSD